MHMPIITSAVLSGSHSVGLVPDPHCSVLESGDIDILATHVSDQCGCVSSHYSPQHLKIVISAETNGQIFVYLNIGHHSNTFIF